MKKFTQLLLEAEAADQAHKMGLKSGGYGRWLDSKGTFVARTVKGKLVKITHGDAVFGKHSALWDHYRQDGSVDRKAKEVIDSTEKYGYFPTKKPGSKNWYLVNNDDNTYIVVYGENFSIYDKDRPHPDPEESGMDHMMITRGKGADELTSKLEKMSNMTDFSKFKD